MSFGVSDINSKQFMVSVLRGYKMSDVDEFQSELSDLAKRLEDLEKRIL